MSFKRPYVPTWGRQRTQAEIEQDERLEAATKALIAPAVSKTEWARAQYRAASRAGMKKEQIEARYNYSDVRIMDEHVDQMFWQMVRHQLRTNPTLNMQLQFIESFYEVPQHEWLNRVKTRYWAQMQKWTDDRRHMNFLTEVLRAFRAAKEQIADVDPANDEGRAHQAWLAADAQRFVSRQQRDQQALERDAIEPQLWRALDEEDEDAEDRYWRLRRAGRTHQQALDE